MFKINIVHILLFLIIICLLYTLLSNCNCNCSKDGFSVGGQQITTSNIKNNDGYLILNHREIVNQEGFSEYYMNNATRIYTTFKGQTQIIENFGVIYSSHFYYVYYNSRDDEIILIEFDRQTRNGTIETTLEIKPIPLNLLDLLNQLFSIVRPGDEGGDLTGSVSALFTSSPPTSSPSTPSTIDSDIAILNPIMHDLPYIPPTDIYIRDVPTMDSSVYSEVNINDPPFGPDIQDNPNEIVQHVNVNAPRIRSLLQIFKKPTTDRSPISDLNASLVFNENIISNDNIDYGYYIGKSDESSPTPISLFCMNQNYLWNDLSNDGSFQYRIDNLTLQDINKYFCNKPHHLSEMHPLDNLPNIDTITNDISNNILFIQTNYPRIYLRQDIIDEVQFYISKSESSHKIVIIQINPESSAIRFSKIVLQSFLQVNRYFLYTQIYNTPTCSNIYGNSEIKNYALRTEETNVTFECDSLKNDYQDILCINRGCSAHECCNEQSQTAGDLTGSVSALFASSPTPSTSSSVRSPPSSPGQTSVTPSTSNEQINHLCDNRFDIPEEMGGHTYFTMGQIDLSGDGQGRCCRSVQNLYDNHPEIISNASPEIQTNLFNYNAGCINGGHTESDSSPSAMNTFNAIACQGIMDDVHCRNGGTLESSPCRCECLHGYTGTNCEKTCDEESPRILPILNRLFESGHRDLLNEQEHIDVNRYIEYCQY